MRRRREEEGEGEISFGRFGGWRSRVNIMAAKKKREREREEEKLNNRRHVVMVMMLLATVNVHVNVIATDYSYYNASTNEVCKCSPAVQQLKVSTGASFFTAACSSRHFNLTTVLA